MTLFKQTDFESEGVYEHLQYSMQDDFINELENVI